MKKLKLILIALLVTYTGYSQLAIESFEGTWPPTGWSVYNIAGPQQQWVQESIATSGTPAYDGTYYAYINRENVSSSSHSDDYLVTAPFIVPSNPQLKFASRLTIPGISTFPTIYKVMLLPPGLDASNPNNYVQIQEWGELEINPSQTDWVQVKVSNTAFAAYVNEQVRLAFVMQGDNGDRWLVDKVQVVTKCNPPTALDATNITTSSASLSWNSPDNPSHFEIEIVNQAEAHTGVGTVITQNPYTATATTTGNLLLTGNNYKYYVRALCGYGGTENNSDWTGPFNFTILQEGETCATPKNISSSLPYIKTHENFIGSYLYTGSPGTSCGSGTASFLSGSYTVYSYTATSNMDINVSVEPLKNATGVFIYDSCNSIGINCLAGMANILPLTKTISNFPVNNGTTYYIVVATTEIANSYSISVSQSTSTSPIIATFSIDSDCLPASGFDAVANVTGMGNATTITATAYDSSNNPSPPQTISAPGQIIFPSYSNSQNVRIVLESQQNPNCVLVSPPLSKELCPPGNDECTNAISLVNNTIGNVSSTPGTLSGATASPQISTCAGSEDDDVWFQFTAVANRHLIYISNVNGSDMDIDIAIYEGAACGNLNQIACSENKSTTLTGLTIGQTYKIRVYSKGSQSSQTTFSISTIAFSPNCTDNNPQSDVVKNLVIDLLNHLIDVHEDIIETEGEVPGSQGYFCPELTALAPYITDSNPLIHHFALNSEGLSFSFSDHGAGTANADIFIPFNSTQYIEDINFFSYSSPQVAAEAYVTYIDGVSVNRDKTANFSHINFCPDSLCNSVLGNISINGAMDCVTIGSVNGFIFQSENENIEIQSWTVYKVVNDIPVFFDSDPLDSPSMSFADAGSYIIKVTVTTPDNCSTTIQKSFEVLAACPQCTETDNQAGTIKQLYINLANYLISNYTTLQNSQPFNCLALAALSPYITDANPLIYNLSYNNGVLSFSFSDHGGSSDVTIQNNGVINDISLLNFTSASVGATYLTNYLNGTVNTTNYIKHINFCPGNPCSPINGNIIFDTGLSCTTTTESPLFSFQTSSLNIGGYAWTFFDGNGDPINAVPITSSHHSINFPVPGNYAVQLIVNYGNGCSATFTKSFVVALECTTCTENSNQAGLVKQLYINLANHLISIFSNSEVLPSNPYTCPEMQALAPFISENNAKIWNASYNETSNLLTFSFSDHGTTNDVSILVNGPITDINIIPFTTPANAANFTTYYSDGTASSQHSIRHIEFCPPDCSALPGEIDLVGAQSCATLHMPVSFNLIGNTADLSYQWFFYTNNPNPEFSTAEVGEMTYHTAGQYQVKLIVTNDLGCTQTYFKTVVVSESCNTCTETNAMAGTINLFYKILLNKLLNVYEQGLTINNTNVSLELAVLAPYISDPNPGIFNINYSNQTLSFSFSSVDSQPDVVVNNYGDITDINVFNFGTASAASNLLVTYENGTQSTLISKHLNFCPEVSITEPEPCESHVSFVIDESGSINEFEADNIKKQLLNFVEQQANSNMTVSFVGMSNSDDNLRTDHVYGKITSVINSSGNETGTKSLFESWINNYKSGYNTTEDGISADSDYWLSGLEYAYNQTLKPEIIILITDGSQTEKLEDLKDIISEINSDSHLFIYGLGNGNYIDENDFEFNANDPNNLPPTNDDTGRLMTSLKYLMELPAAEFPASGNEDLLNVAYYEDNNHFDFLYTEPFYFSNQLEYSGIGCGGTIGEVCITCESFQPAPENSYWVSAWVKEERNIQVKKYTNGVLKVIFEDVNEQVIANQTFPFWPEGEIIDGWQRIAGKFTIHPNTSFIRIELENVSDNIPVYFDDVRVHPVNGSMKSFVYDPETFRLMAEHDDNNYSTFYEYDKEGGLIRIKKETSKGIKTIQESRSGTVITPIIQD